MKSIRVHAFGDENVLNCEDCKLPELEENQVLIEVKSIGVNPVETYVRAGLYPKKPNLPYTPGSDAAGIVLQLGKGVTKLSVGDRVYTTASVTGSYAEQMISNAEDVHILDAAFSFEQGAAIGIPYYTAYQALIHKAKPSVGETILIHGASGGVGLACLQIAKWKGYRVIATAGSAQGQRLLKEQGADLILDHHDELRFQKMMGYTEEKGINIILEMLSNANLAKDLEILALHGRVVVIGCRDSVEINPRLMMGKDTSILGMTIFNANTQEKEAMIKDLSNGFASGKLIPVVGKKLKFDEVKKAHADILKEKAAGKMVLEF